jgi:CRP-like cAMP-binding protein
MSHLAVICTGAEPLDADAIAGHLASTHLFGDLRDDVLRELASACRSFTLNAGDILLRQGEPGDHMYVVLEGRLMVSSQDPIGVETLLGEVRAGEHVGEVGLLENAPRMATVKAATAVNLLELSRDALHAFVERHPVIRDALRGTIAYRMRWARTRRLRPQGRELIRALSQCLGNLEPAALGFLEEEVQWETLPRGAILIHQGDPGECLYFVVSGRLRVFGRRDDGSEIFIAEVGPGATIGEMALLSKEPRSASADALCDTELLRLSKNGFDRLIKAHPKTMAVFTRILVARLNQRIRARVVITQLRTMPLVTIEDCEDVIHTEHLVLRNLKITQMYHRLSLELTMLLGHADANWCTFACNASKTAGYSIRREELPMAGLFAVLRRSRVIERSLDAFLVVADKTAVAARVDRMLQAVTDTVSAGNLKVFAELAPIFARTIRTFHADTEYDGEKLARFLADLKPGPTEMAGQAILAEALWHYYEAIFEPNPKKKTELIFLANIKVGLHEQMRLQPHTVDALNAPLDVGLGGTFLHRLIPKIDRMLPTLATRLLRREFDYTEKVVLRSVTRLWRRIVTRSLMTLRLPYGELRLGADVPVLPKARMYADMLQTLENPELVALVKKYDGSTKERRRTRAADWGDLADRMRFIVNLFRSRQKSLELFDQPFLYEQRQEMAANRVPRGAL